MKTLHKTFSLVTLWFFKDFYFTLSFTQPTFKSFTFLLWKLLGKSNYQNLFMYLKNSFPLHSFHLIEEVIWSNFTDWPHLDKIHHLGNKLPVWKVFGIDWGNNLYSTGNNSNTQLFWQACKEQERKPFQSQTQWVKITW